MDWIISDIHGNIEHLNKILHKIHNVDSTANIIGAGDYIDRGTDSKKVVDRLTDSNIKCLRGNHDDVFCYLLGLKHYTDFSNFIKKPVSEQKVLDWWLRVGKFEACLASYGIFTKDLYEIIDELQIKVPENHKKFFNDLELFWENDTHFCAHASIDPKITLNLPITQYKHDFTSVLWSTLGYKVVAPDWNKIGIFGHSSTFFLNDSWDGIKHKKFRFIDGGVNLDPNLGSIIAYCVQTDSFIYSR